MYKITVWNKKSMNFNKNNFVRNHGTSQMEFNSEHEALANMSGLIYDLNIILAVMEGPMGHLKWERNQEYDSECDGCNCDTCENNWPDDEEC